MSLRRLTLDEVGVCAAAGEALRSLVDPGKVELISTDGPDVDEHNLIASVDGATTIAELTAALSSRDLFSPLQLLAGHLRLVHAAASFAPLFDKAVHHADLLLPTGELVATPRAPRSAVGPDALGFALVPGPVAVIRRAGLALFSRRALVARVCPGDAASLMQAEMKATHSAMVTLIDDVVTVYDGRGDEPLPIPSLQSATAALALGPLSMPSIEAGSVLVGFPRWGRLLRFTSSAAAQITPVPDMFAALERRGEAHS